MACQTSFASTGGLERTWFGGGADIKLKALSKAKELCVNWN
jgi:hypothetical protein